MKKLVRHGNSLAIVIDKPLLKLLKADNKTTFEISIEENALIIKPVRNKKQKTRRQAEEIDEIAERIMEKYATAFEKLAKN